MAGNLFGADAAEHGFQPFTVLNGHFGIVRIGYVEQTADESDGVMRESFIVESGVPGHRENRRTIIIASLYRGGNWLIFRLLHSLDLYFGILTVNVLCCKDNDFFLDHKENRMICYTIFCCRPAMR